MKNSKTYSQAPTLKTDTPDALEDWHALPCSAPVPRKRKHSPHEILKRHDEFLAQQREAEARQYAGARWAEEWEAMKARGWG